MVAAAKKKKVWSYADYCEINDGKRYELIAGKIYAMNAPTTEHQRVSIKVLKQFLDYFDDKPCEVFHAPVDVALRKKGKADHEIFDVVQPDLLVVCDEKIIEKRGIFGTPDLVIEIFSPSTASHDNIRKRRLYEENGVKEYWLIGTEDRLIRVYKLDKDRHYRYEEVYDASSTFAVAQFPGLEIDCGKIFPKNQEE
ncbi:MAG: Uma2 family endonuclease [Candidatus Rifleibacteriota bacterium]